ncbi:flavodoxin family protein [Streptomyces yaizuensis]|uniref:NAD(P)H-dependent oxidoreductase n=1 Tax=Streptomyces yaizuensis TaxID=2989713 RepID=A0ABQ5NXH3_9ACTN|nr:NAD(P)H-dependent oxidoreductase [Streptomyces sp. YSPA8]GLF94880.1 NAD(P)H-dependent oxidoreductase [Streptomyces sp. YSPA8]
MSSDTSGQTTTAGTTAVTTDTDTEPDTDTGAGGPTGRSFLFVLGSSRPDGNSEILARAAAERLPAGVPRRWVDLSRLDLPDFQDGRHETGEWPVSGSEAELRDATLAATDIVLVTPLYWYTVSAQMKRYLDYWSGWHGIPGLRFKERMADRTLWGVTVMADREESRAGALVATLDHSAAFLGMRFGGVLLGNGSKPGQVRTDERALARAATFFQRVPRPGRFPRGELPEAEWEEYTGATEAA